MHFYKLACVLLCACLFTSCSNPKSSDQSQGKSWLPSGQILISRPVPPVSVPSSESMLGFIPVIGSHSGLWLSINLKTPEISLMEGSRVVTSTKFEGGSSLAAGSYQILHMQKSPLWYAPDSYFTARNLSIPPQGDRARFRRGALGEYAIFLNKDTPIHCGPVWSDDVGGIRISEGDMAKIYNQLQVGSIIEVK